ncbi:hypothetical protein BJ085DRAFT_30288 [Dimargaris cristalligena]|uniref:Uncharacterized protein n=1 Tax=Dimargaris cristalligena TaxID=215637 RepID=A0A4V1J4D4_9FUNG|nr:hypothetical protein BJ085DRAFT_30288 [Dimargaris cristalligena]|eukprot:RKP35169.1 hypothetical protein BJ085DRAFT_30288 [Dimargaris cristalligena]
MCLIMRFYYRLTLLACLGLAVSWPPVSHSTPIPSDSSQKLLTLLHGSYEFHKQMGQELDWKDMGTLRTLGHGYNNFVLNHKFPADGAFESFFEFYVQTACTQANLNLWTPRIKANLAAALPLFLGPYMNKGLSLLTYGERIGNFRIYAPATDGKLLKRKYPLLYLIEQGFIKSAVSIFNTLSDYLVRRDLLVQPGDDSLHLVSASTTSILYWVARDMLSMGILSDARGRLGQLANCFEVWSDRWLDGLILVSLALGSGHGRMDMDASQLSNFTEANINQVLVDGLEIMIRETQPDRISAYYAMREDQKLMKDSLVYLYGLWAIELGHSATAQALGLRDSSSPESPAIYLSYTYTAVQRLQLTKATEYLKEKFPNIGVVEPNTFPGEQEELMEYSVSVPDHRYSWNPKAPTAIYLELEDL